ncbi:hypothetical protein CPC08DRAFT_770048 [Agrocybe pediades]|nr:hypothetical protein CPC08DRAFT_770048 [Agrocybe pediades]
MTAKMPGWYTRITSLRSAKANFPKLSLNHAKYLVPSPSGMSLPLIIVAAFNVGNGCHSGSFAIAPRATLRRRNGTSTTASCAPSREEAEKQFNMGSLLQIFESLVGEKHCDSLKLSLNHYPFILACCVVLHERTRTYLNYRTKSKQQHRAPALPMLTKRQSKDLRSGRGGGHVSQGNDFQAQFETWFGKQLDLRGTEFTSPLRKEYIRETLTFERELCKLSPPSRPADLQPQESSSDLRQALHLGHQAPFKPLYTTISPTTCRHWKSGVNAQYKPQRGPPG